MAKWLEASTTRCDRISLLDHDTSAGICGISLNEFGCRANRKRPIWSRDDDAGLLLIWSNCDYLSSLSSSLKNWCISRCWDCCRSRLFRWLLWRLRFLHLWLCWIRWSCWLRVLWICRLTLNQNRDLSFEFIVVRVVWLELYIEDMSTWI